MFIAIYFIMSFFPLAQADDNGAYFPLKVGNMWQYKVDNRDLYFGNWSTYETVEVLNDTVLANGKTYYYVTGFGDNAYPMAHGLIRFDTLSQCLFHSCETNRFEYCDENNEFSFYNFDLPDSAQIFYFCPESCCCFAQYQFGFGPVGNLPDSADFKSFGFCPGGVGVGFTFSKNYGVSAWSIGEGGSSAYAKLIYAKINGLEFGEYYETHVESKPVVTNTDFQLDQNYPNPFNSSTTIYYTINKPGKVRLQVYNSAGQVVKTLFDEYRNSGRYSVNFNAQNLPSGVYFYQLKSDTRQSLVKEFVYLK